MGQDETRFSELQLGVRELFRIAVPGAYGGALLYALAPASAFVRFLERGTFSQLLTVFFLGLFGYALRLHERQWPYYLFFESHRNRLNDAIAALIGGQQTTDHVEIYKYFLQTKATELRDRVHYFSSFYYMLTELSFFSIIAAVTQALWILTKMAESVQSHFPVLTAVICVAASLVLQTLLLVGLCSIRERWQRRLSFLPFVLILVSLSTLLLSVRPLKSFGLVAACQVLGLLILSIAFERLATKQWKAIIGEQIILVREKADDIRKVAECYQQGAAEN